MTLGKDSYEYSNIYVNSSRYNLTYMSKYILL